MRPQTQICCYFIQLCERIKMIWNSICTNTFKYQHAYLEVQHPQVYDWIYESVHTRFVAENIGKGSPSRPFVPTSYQKQSVISSTLVRPQVFNLQCEFFIFLPETSVVLFQRGIPLLQLTSHFPLWRRKTAQFRKVPKDVVEG